LLSFAFDGPDPGLVADALRRALDRTTQQEHAVRTGAGLAKLAFERLGDPTVGVEALRRVRKKAPGNVRNLLNLAEASASIKLWSDAAEIASSAVGITRDATERLRATVLLALVETEIPDGKANAKRDALSAEKLAEAIAGEQRGEQLARLSVVYGRLGDQEGRLRVLGEAVLHGGASKKPIELLAQACAASTFDGATTFAKTILGIAERARKLGIAVEPSWFVALGKLEATALSKPREGIARLKEAIMLDPDRFESYEALTDVYGTLGAHDESVKELLAILPDVAARGIGPDRIIPLFGLLARECKLARRAGQAATAESVVAYLQKGTAGPPATIPPASPVVGSLAGPALGALLPPEASRPWLDVAGALLEIMPKLLRVDPFALGLAPRDKLPARAPHPMRALCDRFARAFGEPRFDLFVDAATVGVPRIVPSEPPAIVLPRGYGDLAENEQAAGICRLLIYIALNVPWLEDLGASDLEGLLLGAMRVGNDDWQDGALSASADANAELWRPRVSKAVARKHKRALEEIVARTNGYVEPETFRQAMRRASMRAAYVLTADLPSTLNHLLRTDRELSQVARTDVAQKLLLHGVSRDLFFFALGPESLALRRAAGTA
jgi:hypothetical protein